MILGALIDARNGTNALDVGAGTGVLSLMVVQRNPTIVIDAIEIHEAAAKECLFNVQQSAWPRSVNVHHTDIFYFKSDKKYDVIFSNPPFYMDGLKSGLVEIDKAKHMSRQGFIEFIHASVSMLAENGVFTIIIPGNQRDFLLESARLIGLFPRRIVFIHANEQKLNKRVVIDFVQSNSDLSTSELTIRNLDGSYHSSYIELTKDFHFVDVSKKA